MVDGKSFRTDEVRYIQRRAAEHDERIVTVGQLVLSRPKAAMHGCSMLSTTWPRGWPVMAIFRADPHRGHRH
jgi:hypothetical protein